MTRIFLGLMMLLTACPSPASAQPLPVVQEVGQGTESVILPLPNLGDSQEKAAIAHVNNCGGWIVQDGKKAGKPVVQVSCYRVKGVADLRRLIVFRELRTLEVRMTHLTPPLVNELRSLKALKSVTLENPDREDLKALAHLDCLEELGLQGQTIDDATLDRVVALARDSSVSAFDGSRAGRLKCEASLGQLRSLCLGETSVTDKGLKELVAIPRLERLSLIGNRKVTDAGLSQLATLTNLEELRLEGGSVTDAVLTKLTALTDLRRLALYGTQVTDGGMREIVHFKQLQDFSLVGGVVSDAGLMELAALKKLEHVVVFLSRMTEEGKMQLKKALPEGVEVIHWQSGISQVPCD
jgi:hypothetical protein